MFLRPVLIFVPLPFVVALLLLIGLAAAWWNEDEAARNPPFLALIGLCAVQSIMLGLRWGYDFEALRSALPVLAACVPPLVLLSFERLIVTSGANAGTATWLHVFPPSLVALFVLLMPSLIDAALIVIFLGYAVTLLRRAWPGPDRLGAARLDGAVPAHRALVLAAVSLCMSAVFDLVVLLDLAWTQGMNVRLVVTNANLLVPLLIGLTAIVAARALDTSEAIETPLPDAHDPERDRDALARVDRLLVDERLFRDENLSLSRLARRVGLPARQISGAINRLTQRNVSQYITDVRIAEACRLLRDTSEQVTTVMLESGFQTKSNFNREFRRVTSLSPAAWRAKHRVAQAEAA